jgi:hypothetical protein
LHDGTLIIEYRLFSFFCQVVGLLRKGIVLLSSVFSQDRPNAVFLFCVLASLEANPSNLCFSFSAKFSCFRRNFRASRNNHIVPISIVRMLILPYGFSHVVRLECSDIFAFHNYSAGCSRHHDSSRFFFRTQKQSGIRPVVLEGF